MRHIYASTINIGSQCKITYDNISLGILGYEPAGFTVHPPPQNDRGWVHFFHMGV